MERGLCSMVLDHFVEVTTAPNIEKVDSVNYQDVEVVLTSSLGTPPFSIWIDDKQQVGQNPLKENVGYGKHTAYVVDDVGCSDKYEFEVQAPVLSIPVAVSPNGDGISETFEIPAISEAYPDATIKIYDRFGKKLAEYRGDAGAWDGTYNGMPMPSTDYWYEIEIKELSKTYTGHFTLIRQ
jgi:gliding motility-associated-like protein